MLAREGWDCSGSLCPWPGQRGPWCGTDAGQEHHESGGMEASLLCRRWIHSHEESAPERLVFRPETLRLPHSRGGVGFDLRTLLLHTTTHMSRNARVSHYHSRP